MDDGRSPPQKWPMNEYVCFIFNAKFLFLVNEEEEELEQRGAGRSLSDKVSLYKGDITVLEVDAIVNAGKGLASFFWTCLFCPEEEQHLNGGLLPPAGRSAEALLLR